MRQSLLSICLAVMVSLGGCKGIAGYGRASAFDVSVPLEAGAEVEAGIDGPIFDGPIFDGPIFDGLAGDATDDGSALDGAGGDVAGDSQGATRSFLVTLATAGQAPTVQRLAITADGEVGVAGYLSDGTTLTVLGEDQTSAGKTDFFVLRIDPDGRPRWVRKFGGGGFDRADGLDAIGADALLLSGYFQQTVDFGKGPLSAANGSEAFALRIDASGSTEWQYTTRGTGLSVGSSVVAHETEEATLFGHFSGGLDPLPSRGAVFSSGETDLFLVRLDNQGNAQWAKSFGGSAGEIAGRACSTAGGLLVLGGQFEAEVDFGGGPRIADNGDGFVLALRADGAYAWDYTWGGPERDSVRSLLPLVDGTLAVKPLCAGTVDFGGGELDCSAGAGPLVWLDQMGSYQSGATVPGTFDSFAAVSDAELVVISQFRAPMDFGGGQRTPVETDTALVFLDHQGRYLRDIIVSGAGRQQVAAAAFDRDGTLVVAGLFTEALSLPGGLSAADPQGLFIARVD